MNKTILITGATGLVGSNLVPQLLKKGHIVKILTTGNRKDFKGASCFKWSLDAGKIDPIALDNVTDIIHLAGANIGKKWSPTYKQKIIDSRVLGPRLLANQLIKNGHKIDSYISAAGIGIYPDSYEWQYENSEYGNGFLPQVCKSWEASSDSFKNIANRIVKLRIGVVLDRNQGALNPLKQITNLGIGSGQGNGKQYFSWVSINDLVSLFSFCLENKIDGVYNATSPNPVTNKEFMRLLAKAMKRPFILPNIPSMVMKIIMGEMSTLVLTSNRVSSEKIRTEGFQFENEDLQETLLAILK